MRSTGGRSPRDSARLGEPLRARSDRAFDACTNIAVGTAALADYQARCFGDRRPDHSLTGRNRRRRRRAFDTYATRSCVLTLFARDLGLESEPSALLRRFASGRGRKGNETIVAPPERSGVFSDGGADRDAAGTSLPIFLEPPATLAQPR
jgi:hypothetical protein